MYSCGEGVRTQTPSQDTREPVGLQREGDATSVWHTRCGALGRMRSHAAPSWLRPSLTAPQARGGSQDRVSLWTNHASCSQLFIVRSTQEKGGKRVLRCLFGFTNTEAAWRPERDFEIRRVTLRPQQWPETGLGGSTSLHHLHHNIQS